MGCAMDIEEAVREKTEFLYNVAQVHIKELNQKLAKATHDRDRYAKHIEKMHAVYRRALKEISGSDACWGCPCTNGRTNVKCPLEDAMMCGCDECVDNLVKAARELIEKET